MIAIFDTAISRSAGRAPRYRFSSASCWMSWPTDSTSSPKPLLVLQPDKPVVSRARAEHSSISCNHVVIVEVRMWCPPLRDESRHGGQDRSCRQSQEREVSDAGSCGAEQGHNIVTGPAAGFRPGESRQGLLQVRDQVRLVLDADRQPHQAVAD